MYVCKNVFVIIVILDLELHSLPSSSSAIINMAAFHVWDTGANAVG